MQIEEFPTWENEFNAVVIAVHVVVGVVVVIAWTPRKQVKPKSVKSLNKQRGPLPLPRKIAHASHFVATWKENQSKFECEYEASRGEPRRGSSTRVLAECPVRVDKDISYSIDTCIDYKAKHCIYIWIEVVLRFCCCFSFVFSPILFLGNCSAPPLESPSPNDWQFPASPLAQSLSPCTISPCLAPPLVVAVNCVQLCINECIWPRARTQVWEFLHEMLHALAPAGLTMRREDWRVETEEMIDSLHERKLFENR